MGDVISITAHRPAMKVQVNITSEVEVRASIRANLAAVIGLMHRADLTDDDCERALELINKAWGEAAAILISRIDP